jgi:hypothetical protein
MDVSDDSEELEELFPFAPTQAIRKQPTREASAGVTLAVGWEAGTSMAVGALVVGFKAHGVLCM